MLFGWQHPITDLAVTLTEAKGRLCEGIPQLAHTEPTVGPAMYLMSGVNPMEKHREKRMVYRYSIIHILASKKECYHHNHLSTS